MKKLTRIILPALALVMMAIAPAMAEDGSRLFLRKGCTSCHGVDAKSTVSTGIPRLAGQHKDYLAAQLRDYKNKARKSSRAKEMIPFANSLDDTQIDAVATYLSGL